MFQKNIHNLDVQMYDLLLYPPALLKEQNRLDSSAPDLRSIKKKRMRMMMMKMMMKVVGVLALICVHQPPGSSGQALAAESAVFRRDWRVAALRSLVAVESSFACFQPPQADWSKPFLVPRPQGCPSNQELQTSLRQVEKMLATHEVLYQKSLRSLRKKLSVLYNSTAALASTKTSKNASCPRPELPAHSKRLGRVFSVGHEVHFLCKSGYELIGPQTRVCLESRKWSGQKPMCRPLNSSSSSSLPSFSPRSPPAPPPPPPSTPPLAAVRPSHCTQSLGSTRCSCEGGFTISGRDNSMCTDLDECELFPLGRPGRLCAFRCVNTPGSFHCVCPAGYNLADDAHSCKDVDECESRRHNCSQAEVCVNTYGGFQCETVDCPRSANATYVKTSPVRCDKNPCVVGDAACSQEPNSISFHFLSLVSNMSAPRVLFRVSAARLLGDTLRFSLAGDGSQGRGSFSVQRSGRQTGTLLLTTPVAGPARLQADVEMTETERQVLLGRYLTKVVLLVSQYDF
ncbi:Fibulin-7 [Merluccius polli]|uniref:Fibulin-7 n=1 Tax=Merluccius polli TaxID=89951 RepID=A0AA47MM45_MERPO|nr:Fibulin-7 [Merluccius polli]